MTKPLCVSALAIGIFFGQGCTLLFDGSDLRGTGAPQDSGPVLTDLGPLACRDGGMARTPSFADPATFPSGAGISGLVAADFDADGKLDFATSNIEDNDVTILYGLGPLSFAAPKHYPTSPGPHTIAIGDLDGNGKPDILVAGYDDSAVPEIDQVSVLLNQGGRNFKSFKAYATGPKPVGLTVANLVKDAPLRVITANSGGDTVSIFTVNADGTLQTPSVDVITCPYGGSFNCTKDAVNPNFVAAGDLNGDSVPELVVTNQGSTTVGVLLNDGQGGFPAQNIRNYPTPAYPDWIALADLNHDQLLDIVTAEYDGNRATVNLNEGHANFSMTPTSYVLGTYTDPSNGEQGKGPAAVAVADMNADGVLDLVVANFNSNTVSLFIGHEGGTFDSTPHDFPAGPEGQTPYGMLIRDFNDDCLPDVAIASHAFGGGNVSLLVNTSK